MIRPPILEALSHASGSLHDCTEAAAVGIRRYIDQLLDIINEQR